MKELLQLYKNFVIDIIRYRTVLILIVNINLAVVEFQSHLYFCFFFKD